MDNGDAQQQRRLPPRAAARRAAAAAAPYAVRADPSVLDQRLRGIRMAADNAALAGAVGGAVALPPAGRLQPQGAVRGVLLREHQQHQQQQPWLPAAGRDRNLHQAGAAALEQPAIPPLLQNQGLPHLPPLPNHAHVRFNRLPEGQPAGLDLAQEGQGHGGPRQAGRGGRGRNRGRNRGHNGGRNPGGYDGHNAGNRGGGYHGEWRGRPNNNNNNGGGPPRRDQGDAAAANNNNGNNEQQQNNNKQHRERVIGFRKLTELAEGDALATMEKLSREETLATFVKLTNEKQLPADWIRLIVTILARVCQVEYKEIVLVLFGRICQKEFLDQVLLHIVQLETDTDRNRRATVGAFFRDLCVLAQGVVRYIPEVACERLEHLVKKAALEAEGLEPFEGSAEARSELAAVREVIAVERARLEAARAAREVGGGAEPGRGARRAIGHACAGPPPEDFRELSVFPTVEDLMPYQPYLRPNKSRGAYDDVEHYLDVQFRLLREDFVRPLREGIAEYCQKVLEMENAPKRSNAKKKKPIRVNNVRAYERVQFVGVKVEEDRIGLELCFDPELRFAANANWEFSKRLMNGALLVLSRDLAFASVVLATVAKRDLKELPKGKILVELCEGAVREDLFRGHFIMMESQVFFGAYAPVLKALKNMDEGTFPLRDYLVYGSNVVALPDYQELALEAAEGDAWFALPLRSDSAVGTEETVDVHVEDVGAWPRPEQLGLDASQYAALCGAITTKLMLIQGPPGTGKTFLGLKIAASLLRNKELWTTSARPRPMLVVCYTNHALDQFLSGLLPATNSIVRVGSGCKDARLEPYTIFNLRRSSRIPGRQELYRNIFEHRQKFTRVRKISDCLRYCVAQLKDGRGVLNGETLVEHGVITAAQGEFFQRTPMLRWLGLEAHAERVSRACSTPCSEAILRPGGDWSAEDVEGAVVLAQLKNVTLSLSISVLEGLKAGLAEKMDGPSRNALADVDWLLDNVRNGLQGTGVPPLPEPFDVRFVRLDRTNMQRRWQIYRIWVNNFLGTTLNVVLVEVDAACTAASNVLQEWKMVEDQAIMASNQVIGMTTSFAASRQKILRQLKPSIVIVEEAAEVLEAHVLVSLTRDVEHLVMIGDHQQLRPNPAVFELARHFHLDVSMFERLVNNGLRCEALSTQHRMRPEISRLICPAIYPHLVDHPSVHLFPDVRGVTKNVFFVDHTQPEEEVKDSQSYQNSHEANFLSHLAKYLWQQGYDSSKITILSTYKGQQYLFSKLRREEAHLKDIRITVVDNYQGEECDIILLSLVRSNAEDKVGFLKTENRVCVALSRARHGFFIIGNMANMTATDTVWRKVRAELQAQRSFGAALPLCCTIHGTVTDVGSAGDFALCPQGGCNRLCQAAMDCGHLCQQVCHVQDREHKSTRCMQPCQKEICPQRHVCPDRCYLKCQPCHVPKMETLACGHTISMPCYKDPLTAKCHIKVPVTLPACQHQRDVKCYQTAHLEIVSCLEPCIIRMKCGHMCEKTCHVLEDPEHEKVKCMKPCGQKRLSCSLEHRCSKMCHEPCEECRVMMNKTLACGHIHKMMCMEDVAFKICNRKCDLTLPDCGHKCSKMCHETCAPCRTKVEKRVPKCGHVQQMDCSLNPADFADCGAVCERLLSCGHKCGQRCRDPCSTNLCQEIVPSGRGAACGHVVMVPCCERDSHAPDSAALLKRCESPCGAMLACNHHCQGTCGTCAQGRVHAACKAKCGQNLICGHSCDQPCAKGCPPCNKPCPVQCTHSRCGARCGELCVPCQEPCPRRCAHKRCPLPCGELCPDEACAEPCAKKVEGCRHDCIGLCGDPCICRECNVDAFEIFFGTEDDEDARFVLLPDCKHILEASGLDRWMLGGEGEDEITQKVCPRCKQVVTTSQRYSNIVKRNAADVAKVKKELYGDWSTIGPAVTEAKALLEGVHSFPAAMPAAVTLLSDVNCAVRAVEKKIPQIESGARKTPPRSLMEVTSLQQYARILRTLSRILEDALRPSEATGKSKLSEAGKVEVMRFADGLCACLQGRSLVRISEQEAADVNQEQERMQRLSQLCQVEAAPGFGSLVSADRDIHRIASEVIRGVDPYPRAHDQSVKTSLDSLAKKVSVLITRQEINMVVAALGMRQGHWYKCPNGHPYVITECGGAMQESRCNECGAAIGGRDHALRRDNQIATEIDGATQPVWPTMMQHYDPAYDSD